MPESILSPDKVTLNAHPADKTAAITAVGELLRAAGHVGAEYIPAMLVREETTTTYLGNGVAIPHGTREAINAVVTTGISVLQVPEGVDFGGGNVAKLIIGIAAKGDDHLDILTNLAEVCMDDDILAKVIHSQDKMEVIQLLGGAAA